MQIILSMSLNDEDLRDEWMDYLEFSLNQPLENPKSCVQNDPKLS